MLAFICEFGADSDFFLMHTQEASLALPTLTNPSTASPAQEGSGDHIHTSFGCFPQKCGLLYFIIFMYCLMATAVTTAEVGKGLCSSGGLQVSPVVVPNNAHPKNCVGFECGTSS